MRLKRYPNRTLFDLDEHRWVKLSDVSRAVRSGQELTVIAGAEERDCTTLVLLQLLNEEAARGMPIPTAPLLEAIRSKRYRSGEDALEQLDRDTFGPMPEPEADE